MQLAEISSRHLQIRFRVLLVLDRRTEGGGKGEGRESNQGEDVSVNFGLQRRKKLCIIGCLMQQQYNLY